MSLKTVRVRVDEAQSRLVDHFDSVTAMSLFATDVTIKLVSDEAAGPFVHFPSELTGCFHSFVFPSGTPHRSKAA